jgi:hypothetical protein
MDLPVYRMRIVRVGSTVIFELKYPLVPGLTPRALLTYLHVPINQPHIDCQLREKQEETLTRSRERAV